MKFMFSRSCNKKERGEKLIKKKKPADVDIKQNIYLKNYIDKKIKA